MKFFHIINPQSMNKHTKLIIDFITESSKNGERASERFFIKYNHVTWESPSTKI